MAAVANLLATVASNSTVSVTVGGSSVAAAALTAPVVYTEPDVDCLGAWLRCSVHCKANYDISAVASGQGADCRYQWNQARVCTGGEGDCNAAISINGAGRQQAGWLAITALAGTAVAAAALP